MSVSLFFNKKWEEWFVHPYFWDKEMIIKNYFFPDELNYHPLPYLLTNFTWHHIKDFLLAFPVLPGGKTVTVIAKACFFIDQDLSDFKRFLSEYRWSLGEVKTKLVSRLLRSLKGRLLIHGGLLTSTDLTLSAKQTLLRFSKLRSSGVRALEIAIRGLKEEFGLGYYQFQKSRVYRRFVHLVLFARPFWQLVLLKLKPEWLIRRYRSIPLEEAPLSWPMAKRKLRTDLLIKSIHRKSRKDADLDKIKEEYEPLKSWSIWAFPKLTSLFEGSKFCKSIGKNHL